MKGMQWQHKGGAFTPYVSRAGVQTREGATLGRPLSLVVALTAGLEELRGGEEPTRPGQLLRAAGRELQVCQLQVCELLRRSVQGLGQAGRLWVG